MKIPYISVVAPALNEEAVLEEFCRRMSAVLSKCAAEYEIILVDDGSTDSSFSLIRELHEGNANIKGLSLSRNFGHASAISAGLEYAQGQVVVIIDADLQDPPEVLPDFFEKWQEGYKVVYGVRRKRKEWFGKRFAYWLFYRVFKKIARLDNVAVDSGDFAVLDQAVVQHMCALPERNRFLRGLRSWIGYAQCGVEYERAARFAGSSKYPLSKLVRLALDGMFAFSYAPLRLATYTGFFVAFAATVSMLVLLYMRIVHGVIGVAGFSSTLLVILFIGAIQLVSIGILGEYIGRIYDEVKRRPLYIIKENLGCILVRQSSMYESL